ncbi:MAG: amino acid-binding protein [Candidatus Omnitrophica bacterium CG11_big_fil_rev_8_21_14_0_20_64_10]|nr:MAG: amino acid-binding protein [Candidatus Omnitrophica bacterium CG11_big_fil_rev_8_21_14_0_20_64_10]
MVRLEKQLSIFVDNRPGGLAKICGTLAEAGINILALTVHDSVDHCIVRILADRPVKALLILEQMGLYILETDVVVMDLPNRPGALADISRKLARADINIEYAYCTATEGQGQGCLILKAEEPDRTLELLSETPF